MSLVCICGASIKDWQAYRRHIRVVAGYHEVVRDGYTFAAPSAQCTCCGSSKDWRRRMADAGLL